MKPSHDCVEFLENALLSKSANIKLPIELYTERDWMKFGIRIPFNKKEVGAIVIPRGDSRRNADPMLLQPETAHSFNEFRRKSKAVFPFSDHSFLIYRESKRDKVLLSSEACDPEPKEAHFADIFRLLKQLDDKGLIVMVNLAGSGASLPQHFHAQIYPKQDSLQRLWNNFMIDQGKLESKEYTIRQITGPLWGLELTLNSKIKPKNAGVQLFNITQNLRLQSQLQLSYNIYIDSACPHVIRILYRESWKERPFFLREVQKITKKYSSSRKARAIRASANSHWRWGWLECIGGMPARDDSFKNRARFGPAFWKEIMEFMSLPLEYRDAILGNLGFQRSYMRKK